MAHCGTIFAPHQESQGSKAARKRERGSAGDPSLGSGFGESGSYFTQRHGGEARVARERQSELCRTDAAEASTEAPEDARTSSN